MGAQLSLENLIKLFTVWSKYSEAIVFLNERNELHAYRLIWSWIYIWKGQILDWPSHVCSLSLELGYLHIRFYESECSHRESSRIVTVWLLGYCYPTKICYCTIINSSSQMGQNDFMHVNKSQKSLNLNFTWFTFNYWKWKNKLVLPFLFEGAWKSKLTGN